MPDWFRDAKFEIWAHWGPQAVPRKGDGYAKMMYDPAKSDYKDHLEWYGPPSEHGYKDMIPLWKAERWNPDELMALYKKTGAKYFVSMGLHHDNFALRNSSLHRYGFWAGILRLPSSARPMRFASHFRPRRPATTPTLWR